MTSLLGIDILWMGGRWHVRKIFRDAEPEWITSYVLKFHANLAARAVALALHTERMPRLRSGRFTKSGRDSYGSDPPESKG